MSFIHQKKQKARLKNIFLIILGIYIMIGTSLYVFQEKLIFLPTVLEQDYEFSFNHEFEEVFLKTDSDALINAIHFKVKNPKGVILFFHGNAGDLSRWGIIAEYFVKQEYDVFIMDYRTYGKSKGALSEKAFYHDGQFCYNYLKERYSESEITIYGRSLGTGIATLVASKNEPKRLVLETPYYSLVDVAKKRFPLFPVKRLMQYKFPTYQFIKHVECPILMLHGTTDKVVPLSSGKKLYDSFIHKDLTFIEIPNASHNNLIDFKEFNDAIKKHL